MASPDGAGIGKAVRDWGRSNHAENLDFLDHHGSGQNGIKVRKGPGSPPIRKDKSSMNGQNDQLHCANINARSLILAMIESRPRPKIRRWPLRRRRRQSAWVTRDGVTDHECSVSDVSERGARINSDIEVAPGSRLGITLVPGAPKRTCEVVWRRGNTLGIKFTG
ncbi:PilZ domain-containing protein [Bradyrhizobium genosp. P]|uniref:PilZ domain-containing protein n=1 Tax=Bradyrhizobium genosp. P TaxID=83641 RepID=UPI003CF04EC7